MILVYLNYNMRIAAIMFVYTKHNDSVSATYFPQQSLVTPF